MPLYGCSFLGFFRLDINHRSIVSAERLPEKKKNIATFGEMRDGSYAESEGYDSASVVPIHTRSELASDSDSAYDSASFASVASVNQPLRFFRALQTSRVHPKLDIRKLSMNQFLNCFRRVHPSFI